MKILTENNKVFEIDTLPNEIDDVQFWVLEYSNEENTDYYTKPLLFLDIFSDMRLDIKVGPYTFQMPKTWNLLCSDKEFGDAEMIPPTSAGFNERGFSAFVLNPLTGFKPEFLPVEVISPLPETKWHVPKLKFGQLLVVPVSDEPNPPCVFITHQKNKVPEVLNIDYLL